MAGCLFRSGRPPTARIGAHGNETSIFFGRWNLSRGLIREGAGSPFGRNRYHHVGVSRAIFHEVVHAGGTGDRCRVDLLAVTALVTLLCGILFFPPIQTVTHGIAFGVGGGSTGIPRESHLVMSSFLRRRLQRRKVCRWAGGKFRLGCGWKCSFSLGSFRRARVRA